MKGDPFMPVLAALVVLLLFTVNTAAASSFVQGNHYEALAPAVRTSDPRRIEVVSLFWYGNANSSRFEPVLGQWVAGLPADVNVVHLPAVWNPATQFHARIFYTARALNLADQLRRPIYDGIHLNGLGLAQFEDFVPLFASAGASRDRFGAAYNSFAVTGQVRNAEALSRGYRFTTVPEIVVNGAYRVRYQGNLEQMVQVADFLVKKVRAERR